MKKSLIFRIFFIAFIVCAGVYLLFLSQDAKEKQAGSEGKIYVDETLPLVLSDLSTENFFKYAAEELIRSAPEENFDLMFDWFAHLGHLKQYNGAHGELGKRIFPDGSEEDTGEYTARVEFESGPALVQVMIVKERGEWKMNGISIDSKALMQ